MKILFMCVANSARSQLAEGIARSLFPDNVEIQSAGSNPSAVNPLAIQVLKEIGIDASKQNSKSIDKLSPDFINSLDYLITLCAEEACPILAFKAEKLHWPLPDPAGQNSLSDEQRLSLFRTTRDAIKSRLVELRDRLNK
jgi:arsenate reductase